MKASDTSSAKRALLFAAVMLACGALLSTPARRGAAQSASPVLISQAGSTRAVAYESTTRVPEPFAPTAPVRFGPDERTRLMLFAMNLHLAPGEDAASMTADAEDEAHRTYALAVEHVGPVPGQEWMTSIVVRLNDQLAADAGDVLVRITYKGAPSNRVRVALGHVGGGPPDDPGSVPTPAVAAPTPTPNSNPVTAGNLSTSDVQTVIAQAVSAAAALNRAVTVAVTDREGNTLGLFRMTGAPTTTRISGGGLSGQGLEGLDVPSQLAAVSKAGTASVFSTQGNAFTSRTASFIIQEHFPPGTAFQPGGPLFGVQFSQLPCSDIKRPALPLGLSADPGSAPLYKNGAAVGGVGIEGDGLYTLDKDPADFDKPFEELVAVAAQRGFQPPDLIRGDNIIVGGVRLAYLNVTDADAPRPATTPFASLSGTLLSPVVAAQPSEFVPTTTGGVSGAADTRFFPFVGSTSGSANALTAADVQRIINQAAQQADITRAAIRQPLGSAARVSISVVDVDGNVLGIFRTTDAPVFGFDVSVQKARTAAFYSNRNAGALLRAAGFGSYVDRAAADGLRLDGSVAFTDRAGGFLSRPFYPDGLNPNPAGPFSREITEWSVFNDGLQLDLVKTNLLAALSGANVNCTSIPNLPNGIQIFPGSVPLYKNGELVGAIGISGDGVEQDDLISAAGANGYEPPAAIRADQIIVRGTRLPFLKFPRSPNL
ncbi:MAG: heme-binding protein [Acidobacteria bacterium]|nr:heme-binding protein [Acidobacteriota bacterium]MBV9929045.1 heme-binding protein [Acidobacteriota bacterium]